MRFGNERDAKDDRESKYRMERGVTSILNGYVDLQTHRAEEFILEHEMMGQ